MKCANCKNIEYCKDRLEHEPKLFGCTPGIPEHWINPPTTWLLCPICQNKTIKLRPDTEAKNLIVYCKKCKKESMVDIKGMESKAVEK